MAFIDNSGSNNLKNRLIELIAKSEELKFLVGFFYFSGISELYSSLKAKRDNIKLRVLVGLEVDNLLSGMVVECDGVKKSKEKSKREIEDNFIKSVKKSLNSDDFDRPEFYEQIDFFTELILEDKLIIRKTKEPNHAKLYIFELADKVVQKSLFITGSSNLTKAGLSHQNEFNVEIKDYGIEEANEYFENLWADSAPITENKALKDRLIKTIENKTLARKITPFQAFVVVLKTYLDSRSGKENNLSVKEIIKKAGYKSYKYQEDAVNQAVKILDIYDGVIIADVVGLGKSIIASAAARVNKKRGIVLCPPGIISEWEDYKSDFGISSWEVLSSGNMNKAKEFVDKQSVNPIETVIVDEAHKFRNSDTMNYDILRNICRNKKVILLSATPFNNSPADILSLLELFTVPKKSPITLDGNLKNSFKIFKGEFDKLSEIKKYHNHSKLVKREIAEKNYKSFFGEGEMDMKKVKAKTISLAARIRSVIEPVTIRRNRLDLQENYEYKNEVKDLSDIKPPESWFYGLTKKQSEFYDELLSEYFSEDGRFTGAIYKPFFYESGITEEENLTEEGNRKYQTQKNNAVFMRRLLVKRFESSFGSFEKSIDNFISITDRILKFINKNRKYILDRKKLESILEEEDEDEVEQILIDFAKNLEENNFPKNNKVYDLKDFAMPDEFIKDIESDLKMYQEIKEKLRSLDMVANDPKSEAIIEEIKKRLAEIPAVGEPKRKIIIFTEYRDTANFLEPILKNEFGERVLYSGSLGAEKIKEIKLNFDASVKKEKQEDKYDILLATDKISEGFNLNRAGMVINYDIPWNPVRVIQRVGRINRISKKVFESLFIVNFFPSEQGAEYVQTEKIAANKMFMIHNVLGEDAKIFHLDEEPTPSALFEKFRQDPDEEKASFETKVMNKFREIKEKYPELTEEIGEYPSKMKVSKEFGEKSLLVFTKKQRLHIQEAREKDGKIFIEELPLEMVYEKIYCDNPELKSLARSDKFWDYYTEIKKYRERTFSAGSQQSVEVKTTNFLKGITEEKDGSESKKIAEILLEDINDYGTIALTAMRRIIGLENIKDSKAREKEFKKIIDELGGTDYLDKIKKTIKDEKKEIIIAIENQ